MPAVDKRARLAEGKGMNQHEGHIKQEHRPAFTLVELLVVIAIISILVGLLIPAMKEVQERTRSVHCLSNLRALTNAAALYSQTARGRLPDRTAWTYDRDDVPHLTLATYLGLPRINEVESRRNPVPSTYTCPSSMRFPGPAYIGLCRTYQLNEHLAGSCLWYPVTTPERRGWDSISQERRAPLFVHRVPNPSGAGLLYDGILWRHQGQRRDTLYYNKYSYYAYFHRVHRQRRTRLLFFPHRMRPPVGGTEFAEFHMDDVINVGFLDGHAKGLYRADTEALANDWENVSFWGQ